MKSLKFALLSALVGGFASQSQAQMPGMEMPATKPTPLPTATPTPRPAPQTSSQAAPKAVPADQSAPPMAMPGMEMPPPKAPMKAASGAAQGTGTPPGLVDRAGWPSPTADDAKRSYLLLDNFEIRRNQGENALGFDILAWQGGDYKRTYFKSEGLQGFSRRAGGEADFQLLRGKLIAPFFDLQYGLRVAAQRGTGFDSSRAYAVIGLQGLSPYRFDVEPVLFLSQKGKLSGRFTGTYDVLLSQKLILQPRFETSFALQSDESFGVGSGLNDAAIGLRLRYEIRRDLAPYLGVSMGRSFGGTKSLRRRSGEDISQSSVIVGVRAWF